MKSVRHHFLGLICLIVFPSQALCWDFVNKNLKADTLKCAPPEADVANLNKIYPSGSSANVITGQILHGKLVYGPYGYNVSYNGKKFILQTNIHFRNPTSISAQGMKKIQGDLDKAAQFWTLNNPYSFDVQFIFKITADKTKAHIRNIQLKNNVNGPYFRYWDPNWKVSTVAHEMGHTLGLLDEYNGILAVLPNGDAYKYCDIKSLMCNSGLGYQQKYHYYLILRRLLCA